jgi:hypothetical protein
MQSKLSDLLARIAAANEAYHTADAPIMTDAEYDALRREADAIHAFARQIKISIFLSALLLSACLISMPTANATSTVPFVGCANGGMVNTPAPISNAVQLDIPATIASHLAIYADDQFTILAPRGWRCIGLVGNDNHSLWVYPANSDQSSNGAGVGVRGFYALTGPGIRTVLSFTGRYFPEKLNKTAIQSYIAASGENESVDHFVAPYDPFDRLKYISKTKIEFETPPGKNGLANRIFNGPSKLPAFGFLFDNYDPKEEIDNEGVIFAAVRLTLNLSNLKWSILASLKKCLSSDQMSCSMDGSFSPNGQ